MSLKYSPSCTKKGLTGVPTKNIYGLASKTLRALGILRSLSSRKYGLRRDMLIMVYKVYLRLIMEFGCLLFSGSLAYKIEPLVLVEREALCPCLALPRRVANNVFYQEANLPSLPCRYRVFTFKTFLKFSSFWFRRNQYIFIEEPDSFFSGHWPRFHTPQLVFFRKHLDSSNMKIQDVIA